MAGSVVIASTTGCYGFSECFAVASVDSLSASVQVRVSDTPPGMQAPQPDRPSSELLEFLRVPPPPIDRMAASSQMVVDCASDGGCPYCDDDNDHHHASFDGFCNRSGDSRHRSTFKCQCTTVDYGYTHSVHLLDRLTHRMLVKHRQPDQLLPV